MKNEIIIDGVTYVRKEKEFKLHDIVNYKGYEWYVIKIDDDTVTLMMKDTIKDMAYSDDNSNDWVKSNVREYLDNWLIDSDIDLEDLIQITTNYDEDKYSQDKIRIPTLREIEALPMNIRNCDNSYWTMTSSYSVSEDCSNARVFFVNSNGYLYYTRVSNTYGVRPVITIRK